MNSVNNSFEYSGDELDLFASAKRWKAYWRAALEPYLGRRILDVGAGIGSTLLNLQDSSREAEWTAIEPDPKMAARLKQLSADRGFARPTRVIQGTLGDVPANERFDTMLYIDVLEHIENDAEEVQLALARLQTGGRLIVLSPAHQFLFSEFDAAIGHYRRYNRASLKAVAKGPCEIEKLIYLDSAGFALSLANRVLLHQSSPNAKQVQFWDRAVVPVSRVLDRLSFNAFGKTILMVLKKTGS